MIPHASRVRAAGLLAGARETLSDAALELAYHLAVPVVVSPTFLHLVRMNFFLDPPVTVAYEDEARLLLSPLCREVGHGFYDIDPDLRTLMIVGLTTRFGPQRLRQVAILLERYTERGEVWGGLPELERAQRLTALSLLKPDQAASWLAGREGAAGQQSDLRPEWFVAMRRRISDQPEPARRLAAEIAQTWCMPSPRWETLNPAALTALMSLPGVSGPQIASVLRGLADDEAVARSLSATIGTLDPEYSPPPPPVPPEPKQSPEKAGRQLVAPAGVAEQLINPEAEPRGHVMDSWHPEQGRPTGTDPASPIGRIAVVGAAGTGKTTFAAALYLAALSHAGADAYWSLHRAREPHDPRLDRAISQLRSRRFPSPVEGVRPLELRLAGQIDEARGGGRFVRPGRRRVDCMVEVYQAMQSSAVSATQTAEAADVERMAHADALLYLVDPVRELAGDRRWGTNFQFFNVLLEALMVELGRSNRLDRGRLPHHVAVCLTKFDHPKVFEGAVTAGLVTFPEHGDPRMSDTQAIQYLNWLCESTPGSGISLLRDGLRRHFHADRLAYFATSSVGFYRPNIRPPALADYRNVVVVGERPHLRGLARPWNVMEPLLHVERAVATRH